MSRAGAAAVLSGATSVAAGAGTAEGEGGIVGTTARTPPQPAASVTSTNGTDRIMPGLCRVLPPAGSARDRGSVHDHETAFRRFPRRSLPRGPCSCLSRARARSRDPVASLLHTLTGGRAKAATFAHPLAKALLLLRGQVPPALRHAAAEPGATGTEQSRPAEQDPAQREESERLPEGHRGPAEERRQQPVPQQLHDFATDEGEQQDPQHGQRTNEQQPRESR